MSYSNFIDHGYKLVAFNGGFHCLGCRMAGQYKTVDLPTYKDAINHVLEHRQHGHKISQRGLNRLRSALINPNVHIVQNENR